MKHVLALIVFLSLSMGSAQLNLTSTLRQLLEGVCAGQQIAGLINLDLAFACTAANVVGKLETFTEDIHNNMKTIGRDLGMDMLERSLSSLSQYTDMNGVNGLTGQINDLLLNIDNNIPNSLSTLRQSIFDALDQARNIALAELQNEGGAFGTAQNEVFNEIGMFSFFRAKAIDDQTEISKDQADLTVQSEASRKIAEETADNTTIEDLSATILTPVVGSAATMRRNAQTAISTRAAIQALTEVQIAALQNDVTIAQDISATLKAMVQQNVMTSAQMEATAQYLLEDKKQEIESNRLAIENAIGEVYQAEYDAVQSIAQSYIDSDAALNDDALDINLAGLGW